MKETTLALLLIGLLTFRCDTKKMGDANSLATIDTTSINSCQEPIVKLVYFSRGCNNEICGFTHYLMLGSYVESCFNDYDFIFMADKYLDSVKKNIPVRSIRFVKPFDFLPEYDSQDFEPLNKNSITGIGYTDSTINHKVPEIKSISIWSNGFVKRLEYIELKSRTKRINSYKRKIE